MARKQSLRGARRGPGKEPQRGIKTAPTVSIAARIDNDLFELIDFAARIREVDRQEILIVGGRKEALRILKASVREIRRYKDKQRRARNQARRQSAKGST